MDGGKPMTDRELMQQALYALEYASDMTKPENMSGCGCPICVTITALRDRLAQPEQEPVAWYDSKSGWTEFHSFKPVRKPSAPDSEWLPLYTTPPQRKPLTDEEMRECAKAMDAEPLAGGWPELIKFARAIEAAHGIKP